MKPKILVVDDEPAVTDLLAYNLRKSGYEPLVAAGGREALRLARHASPDLILLDLMIPEVDGLDVCRSYNSLTIKGYRIDNVVTVTLRDVDKTSRVVAAALKAGANQVLDVQFYTSDLRKYRDQARDLAMKAAREKADDLARAAGANAGCVLSINENSWSYYNGWWWYGRRMSNQQNLWSQNVIQTVAPVDGDSSGSLGEDPITPGQISIKAEIQARFSLSD